MSLKFLNDLNTGHDAEVFVAHWYEERGCTVRRAEGRFPDYDLLITRSDTRPFTVEVKHDLKAHQTNNFFMERRCLEHSKADILVYCYGLPITQLYFLQLPQTLVRLAPHPSNTKGGDQGDYGWLFSKRKFEQILKPKIITV